MKPSSVLALVCLSFVVILAYLQNRSSNQASTTTRIVVADNASPLLAPRQRSGEINVTEDPFGQWARAFEQATPATQVRLLAEGRLLVADRRTAMLEWMRQDPEQAWKRALPLNVYATLPEEIASQIEKPFASVGDIDHLPRCGSGESDVYWLRLTDKRFVLHPFGRRVGLTSKRGVGFYGIRLNGEAVIDPSPIHRLMGTEFAQLRPRSSAQLLAGWIAMRSPRKLPMD